MFIVELIKFLYYNYEFSANILTVV